LKLSIEIKKRFKVVYSRTTAESLGAWMPVFPFTRNGNIDVIDLDTNFVQEKARQETNKPYSFVLCVQRSILILLLIIFYRA
jgi:hypothetical protein